MTKFDFSRSSSCRTVRLREGTVAVLEDNATCLRPEEFAAKVANSKNAKDDCQPFFVMNIDCAAELLQLWAKCLPRVQPFYALNCNADPVLLRLLAAQQSVGFSCTTGAEMTDALRYLPADRVCCSFPCWTRSALRQVEECGVDMLCFDSERDLDRILANHPNAKLLLRVCVDRDSTSANALFGAPIDETAKLLKMCIELGLNCVGISLSIGPSEEGFSMFRLSAVCAVAIEWSASLFRVGIDLGIRMSVLNIGDAFAYPFGSPSTMEAATDTPFAHFTEICTELNRSLDAHFPSNGFGHGVRVMATPGQFFASAPFSLVTNVIGKRCTDASVVTNDEFDAGKTAFHYQTNESYYGAFGCRLMADTEPRCAPLFNDRMDMDELELMHYGTVFGLTGFDGSDIVQSICHFRQLNIGDWLLWSNMGAYAFGNRGSLDDDAEFDTFKEPSVFYFASRANWESVRRTVNFAFPDEQQWNDNRGPFRCSDDYLSDADSDGSVGEAMVHSDVEETNEGGTEEGDEFWPVGWPTKFND